MTGAVQALLCSGAAVGGGGGSVSITPRTVSNTGPGTGTITCGYRLDNDGNVYKTTGTDSLLEAWLDSGTASQFEAMATLTSGDTPSGTLGTWQALSTDRAWSLSAGAAVSKSCTLSVQIRDVATHTVQDTASITISADNSGGGGGGGGGGGTVSISDQNIVTNGLAGHAYSASYKLGSDGNVYGNTAFLESWLDSGAAGDFECMASLSSGGPVSSGTIGAWQNLGADRQWVFSSTASGSCILIVQIRDASSHTVLDSATIQLQLIVSGGGGGGP